jgi:putative ABC transport system permease protein
MAAMVFSVMIYYNFAALKYNPDALKMNEASQYAEGSAQAAGFLLLIFLVFFIWFSSSFFLNMRKKEIGLYSFMGISKGRIGAVFAIESMIQGLAALAAGLLSGVLIGKLFMMLLARVAVLNVTIDFFLSAKSIVETVVVFISIFLLASLKEFIDIARSRLIDLFNAARKEEGPPKARYIKGAASILVTGTAYYYSSAVSKDNFLQMILIVVILVSLGTFWLFGSFFPTAVRFLTGRKSVLYKGINIVSLSNIAFKVRRNYRTLAAMAILIASSITAFGTVTSVYYFVSSNFDTELPYSFTYFNTQDYPDVHDKVRSMITDDGHRILLDEFAEVLYTGRAESTGSYYVKDLAVVKYSDFERITSELNARNRKRPLRDLKPGRGEAVYVEKPGVILSLREEKKDTIRLGNTVLTVIRSIKTPLFGGGVPASCLVVCDEDFAALEESLEKYMFYGIIVDNQEDTWDLAMDLKTIKPLNQSLYAYTEAFENKYNYFGIVFFIGAFLSLVFVIATGSVMYFKLLSDAFADKAKYEILTKIGMTKEEIFTAVSRQVGISFALPLIVGAIHSMVAIKVLERFMYYDLLIPALMSVGAFIGIYAVFYAATTRKFLKIVC